MWAPSWNWILFGERAARGEPGSDLVDHRHHEDRSGWQRSVAAWPWDSMSSRVTSPWRQRLATGWIAARYGLRPNRSILAWGSSSSGCCLSALRFAIRGRTSRWSRITTCRVVTCRPHGRCSGAPALGDPTLSSVSQAGLVNNLNDGMAWGLLPSVFAASQMSWNRSASWRRSIRRRGAAASSRPVRSPIGWDASG